MPAAFPLSSSAGYAFMARDRKGGLSIVSRSEARPGDIALMGPNGNAYAGNGPIGHCGIVDRVDGATVTCIESRGGVGVCFKVRQLAWWSMYVRPTAWTAAHSVAAREWEHRYDALTGSVARVPYYAGQGDNDHDGEPDRADIGDGNGIDCSGAVKLCADYAYDHARTSTAPPTAPVFTREQLDLLIAILKEIDVEHGYFVAEDWDDLGRCLKLVRDGGLFLCEPAGVVPVKWVGGKFSPGDDVMRALRLTNRVTGHLAGYMTDMNGVSWPFCQEGATLPPKIAAPPLPASPIARIT